MKSLITTLLLVFTVMQSNAAESDQEETSEFMIQEYSVEPSEGGKWAVEISPLLWASSAEAEYETNQGTAIVDIDAGENFQAIDAGASIVIEGEKDGLIIIFEGSLMKYSGLPAVSETPYGDIQVDADAKIALFELLVGKIGTQ